MKVSVNQISVKLQDEYSYAIWPIISLVVIVIAAVIIYLFTRFLKHLENREKVIDGQKAWRALSDSEKYYLRMKYFQLLDELYYRVSYNQISVRHCYQRLSRYVREFVSEITGVKVNKCTLHDIKQMNMPMLAALVEEFYAVEFAKVSSGDAGAAIAKTKRVIEIWN